MQKNTEVILRGQITVLYIIHHKVILDKYAILSSLHIITILVIFEAIYR